MEGNKKITFLTLLKIFLIFRVECATKCSPKEYGKAKIVCVCNATYCDTIEPLPSTAWDSNTYFIYTSTKSGLRLEQNVGKFNEEIKNGTIVINRSKQYQEILGFGGAITDAAGININSLTKDAQDNLLRSYFADDGLQYNILRVPMASTDFSTHTYSYAEVVNDTELKYFNLTDEDINFKIPYIKAAQALSSDEIKLMSAPWSAPPWMKTNNEYYGFGSLKKEYYQTWANYFVKFFQEYKKHGLDFWVASLQNEPMDGNIPYFFFNCMGWTPYSQAEFLAENLGPALKENGFGDIKLLIADDQRLFLEWWSKTVMANPKAAQYVSGIGVHWYLDFITSPKKLTNTHNNHPDKFLIYTESCIGEKPWQKKVDIGSWGRGETYASSIIEVMLHWVSGWVDWNLALDPKGSPNWSKNFVDSAIIVNATSNEFYKQPIFYALGHFSKFIPRGSIRIDIENYSIHVESVAFVTPKNLTVVVMINRSFLADKVTLFDPNKGGIEIKLPSHSMHTIIY